MQTVKEALAMGKELKAAGKFDAALAAFERVLALDPLNIPGLAAAAQLQQELGLIPEAIGSYRRYLEQDPLSTDHVVKLTRLLIHVGDAKGAWNTVIHYVDAGGTDAAVAISVAHLALQCGGADIAQKLVSRMMKDDPDNINMILAYLEIAGLSGDFATVIRLAGKVHIHNPNIQISSRHVNIPHYRFSKPVTS